MGSSLIIFLALAKSSFVSTEKLFPLIDKVPILILFSKALNNSTSSIFSRLEGSKFANFCKVSGLNDTIDKWR